jgi:hypothetical protein
MMKWVCIAVLAFSTSLLAAPKKKDAASKAPPQKAAATAPAPAVVPAPPQDPDLPGFMQNVDKEAYLSARASFIASIRGFDDLAKQPDLRVKAVQQMQQQKGIAVTANPATWTEIGPFPIPNGQTETTPMSVTGRVTAFAIDPTAHTTVYLGTANGGVWRSLDGGTTWAAIFDTATSLAIGALALAPSDHTILYVGTGEANGSGDSFAGVGLYRINSANTTATLNGPINPTRSYTAGDGITLVINPIFNGSSISSILVHPTDPATVFVGTAGGVIGMGGDPPLGNTIPPIGIRGLYRSTNATSAPASVTFTKLAVSAGTSPSAPFDTPNTGNRNVDSMVFPDLADPNQLVVWMNGLAAANDGGVFRSINALGAATFTHVFTTTLSNARATFANYSQGSAPLHVIYAATGETRTGTLCVTAGNTGALRRSTDGGLTWSAKLSGGGGFCGGQCFYDIGIDVRPGATAATSDDVLWLGGNVTGASSPACSLLHGKSTDGAATSFVSSATGLHPDTHFIIVDPTDANIVYHGNDGGVWKSTNAGSTWTSLNTFPLSATQFQSASTHPLNANYTIGGTQDNGTNMYTTGAVWNRVDFGDGGYARIDKGALDTTTVTMYHTYFNGLGDCFSTSTLVGFGRVNTTACAFDTGTATNWSFKGLYCGAVDATVHCDGTTDTFNGIDAGFVDTAVLFYAPIELGPGTPNQVYFGTDRLYRSINKGDTMSVVSQTPIVSGAAVRTIAISPQSDSFRLVGLSDTTRVTPPNNQVWGTTTGSSVLTNFTTNLPTPLKKPLRVIFDPSDATGNTAYVGLGGYWGTTTGHVWKTTNLASGTPTWVAASGSGGTSIPDVPVNSLLVDPLNSSHVYAGTDIGVYYSSDGGTSWNPLGTAGSLPVVPIFEMAFTAGTTATRIIRVATHGRGMWDLIPPTPVNLMTFTAD